MVKRLFLDTEFNGFGGELISMALVSVDDQVFYEVLPIPAKLDPFVEGAVIPKLGKPPIEEHYFDNHLLSFLLKHDGCEIVADWPADFEHLCAALSRLGKSVGWHNPVQITMRLVESPTLTPHYPHNALSDALALRDWYMSQGPLKGVCEQP